MCEFLTFGYFDMASGYSLNVSGASAPRYSEMSSNIPVARPVEGNLTWPLRDSGTIRTVSQFFGPHNLVVTNTNRSRVILPPQVVSGVAQSLAADVSTDDLLRLKGIFEEAQRTDASGEEVVTSVEKEVPAASFLAPLLKDAGTPLAVWIGVVLAVLALLIPQLQKQPTITPEQIQDIVTRVVNEVDDGSPAEPPPVEKDPHQRH
jgi:hypothetical protein